MLTAHDRSGRQSGTPLCAPPGQYVTATLGRHARAETVRALPAHVVRLIGTFHVNKWSANGKRAFYFRAIRIGKIFSLGTDMVAKRHSYR